MGRISHYFFLREGGFCAVRTRKPGLSTHLRCLARTYLAPVAPEEHRKIGISGSQKYDPSYLAVTCSVFARGAQDYGLFWENTPGYAVFSASWFSSGYMLLPVCVVVGTVSVYSAMLVPQWYMLCVSHGVSCLVVDAPRAVFLRGVQALMPCIMAGMDQRDSYVASQLQFIMVVVIPVITQRQIPMVLVTKKFPWCWTKVIDVPVVQVVQLPGWWSRRAENCGFSTVAVLGRGDVPVVERQVSFSGQCRKLRSSHRCSSRTFSSRQC